MFEISDRKLDQIIGIATAHNNDLDANTIENFILADWREGQGHQDWLDSATAQEIADWVIAGLR